MRRTIGVLVGTVVVLGLLAGPALACGGLVAADGNINLVRTTTLAAYHRGVEHYVTSFTFAGGGAEVGSIVPLPGVPTKVERGGDWTLQRLIRETQPVAETAFDGLRVAAPAAARVILQTKIDALEITVLEGGAEEVGLWAKDHGFLLPPDAPEVLAFYADRSPIFMAARFDAAEARRRGQDVGDGTPIHVTIPTPNPWVPLRILGLGRKAAEVIQADVYLLTDRKPAMLTETLAPPSAGPGGGVFLQSSALASETLLADLRSDQGMGWMPESGMWLSYLRVDAKVRDLRFDLAVDASGQGAPSRVAAGLVPAPAVPARFPAAWALVGIVAALAVVLGVERRLSAAR